MSPRPRFLLVRLEDDLQSSRVVGIFHTISLTPGVEAVWSADIAGLDTDHLELLGAAATIREKEDHLKQGELFIDLAKASVQTYAQREGLTGPKVRRNAHPAKVAARA